MSKITRLVLEMSPATKKNSLTINVVVCIITDYNENLMKIFFLGRVLRIRNYSHYVFKGVTTFDSGGKLYFTPQKFRFNPISTLF